MTADFVERQDVFYSNVPAGSSIYNLEHMAQQFDHDSPQFQRFDHGSNLNLKLYGQLNPPHYNLSNIEYAIAIFAGGQDKLADAQGV